MTGDDVVVAVSSGGKTVGLLALLPYLRLRAVVRGLRRATGDVIVLCDQDDRWRSDKLARLESVLSGTSALAAVSDGRIGRSSRSASDDTLWETANFTGRHRQRWEQGDHIGLLLRPTS